MCKYGFVRSDLECPVCSNRSGFDDHHSMVICCHCEFEGRLDHFIKTAEITKLRKEQKKEAKLIVERIWFEIKNNVKRYDLHWEWIEEVKCGDYLERNEILTLIEKHLGEVNDK